MRRRSGVVGRRARTRLTGLLLATVLGAIPLFANAAADRAHGHDLYLKHCASCHGIDGRSVVPNTPQLSINEGMMQPDIILLNKFKMGLGQMPPFFGILSDKDLLDVIAYLRTVRF